MHIANHPIASGIVILVALGIGYLLQRFIRRHKPRVSETEILEVMRIEDPPWKSEERTARLIQIRFRHRVDMEKLDAALGRLEGQGLLECRMPKSGDPQLLRPEYRIKGGIIPPDRVHRQGAAPPYRLEHASA